MATAELTEDDVGPSIHLDNSEEVTSNISEFSQVIFNNVQECYLPANDLQCNYTLTPSIKPQSRDWIGVFKVGWTSTRQYRAFEWAVCPASWTEGDEWNQDITFKAYYLPKDEDGEYYQLCYIDAAGKMRGASTPFQFLEQSADDFVQVLDDSMDILMIHNKTEYCVEELKRVQDEKREIEEECNSLKEKVITLETELKNAKKELETITKEYRACADVNLGMEKELKSMSSQLNEAEDKVAHLTEEAGKYESSLQQTEGAFMEVVNRELALRNKLDELEKQFTIANTDKNNLKEKLEASEKNKAEMCEEIDSLKQLLSQSNETHQEVRESEVRMKEQYHRMHEELLQAAVDKDQYQMMESRFATTEASRVLLAKELDSLKMVQEKLSKDLVVAKTEKESLRVAMERQKKEMREEKKKMQLSSHQNRERQTLLQEQISALKDGIQQLAQEKEMASKGSKGSQEAQLIATKDLKDKVRRAQFQSKEEVRRRSELQKKMISMETNFREEKNALTREVEDLRLRLQMAAEEYKKVYTECRQLETKLEKKKLKTCAGLTGSSISPNSSYKDPSKSIPEKFSMSEIQIFEVEMNTLGSQVSCEQSTQEVQASTPQTSQSIQASNQSTQAIQATTSSQASNLACQASQATTNQLTQGSQATTNQSTQGSQAALRGNNEEKATQSGLPAVAVKSEGALMRPPSRDDTFDLKEMHDQMCSMAKELDERKKDTDHYKRLYQEEREKSAHMERVWRLKHQSLESKSEELHEKYNKMLNDYTKMKHSYESLKFDVESQHNAQTSANQTQAPATAPVPTPNPGRTMQFPNPYAQNASPPPQPLNGSPQGLTTRFGNPYAMPDTTNEHLPSALMEMSIDSMNLDSIRYPPDTVEDAALSDVSDPVPPVLLPEPLQPDVLPEAKIAAIKMVSSQMELKTSEDVPMHTDDEREEAQFVDAQEFPEEAVAPPNSSPIASAPPLPDTTPPATPPTTPTLENKKCPECVIEFPPTYPEEEFVKHVQRHFARVCPSCHGLLHPEMDQMSFERHVQECMERNQ